MSAGYKTWVIFGVLYVNYVLFYTLRNFREYTKLNLISANAKDFLFNGR